MVNKVDRAILELMLDGEAMYKNFDRVIQRTNVVASNYASEDMGNVELDPTKGNVAFGSGKDCWGFTLKMFAEMYSKKFGIAEDKMMQKLWGDNFYDAKNKVWRSEAYDKDGKPLTRAFVQFIMDPINKLSKACMANDNKLIEKMLITMKVELTTEEKEETGKKLLKSVIRKWIDASIAILEMMVLHLPSPPVAQKYRTGYLYEGPIDDPCAKAMIACDNKGPLMMYVSKMVPTNDKGRFYAFGRVFSGTVQVGQKVRIMGPNYVPGSKKDVYEKAI